MCVIRGCLTDRPMGVHRVYFGRATRACTYIGPLVSSAPSVIKSSSPLGPVSIASCPGWALFQPWCGPTLGLWLGPLGRPPRLKATVPVALLVLTLLFFFLLSSSCLRVLITHCWPTYLCCVCVSNMFAYVLYLRIALAAPCLPLASPLPSAPRVALSSSSVPRGGSSPR